MSERRDRELGAILDQLDALEHGPGYWEALSNAAEPELARLREQADREEPRRKWGGRRRTEPIAALVQRHPTFGGGFRVRLWVGGALIGALVVALALLGLSHDGGNGVTGPQPATAAQAVRLSLDVLSDTPAVRGTVRTYDNGFTENGETVLSHADSFLATRDGSVRIETLPDTDAYFPGVYGSDAKVVMTYDAAKRRFQYLLDAGPSGTVSSVEEVAGGKHARYQWYAKRHVAAGPPDGPEALDQIRFWQLRAYLRTLLSKQGVDLKVQSVDGRPSWIVTAPWVVGGGTYRVTITIDATTRLPYELEYRAGNRVVTSYFDVAACEAPTDADAFTIQAPPAGQTRREAPRGDFMSTFLDLPVQDPEKVRNRTHDLPVQPSWVPSGFELKNATVTGAHEDPFIVSLVYRRGFDQITVTTRWDPRLHGSTWSSVNGSTPERTDTSNPFIPQMSSREKTAWEAETARVRLSSGGFSGRTAHIVTDPQYWPHLWVKNDLAVATVAGDLTARQMVRIAESLRPWGDRE